MFDPFNGIEVEVLKPSGDPYHGWKAPPSSELHTPDKNQCFIEAETGGHFTVRVKVYPNFSFQGCPTLCVDYDLDDRFGFRRRTHRPDTIPKQPRRVLFDQLKEVVHKERSEDSICALTFGEVKIVDDPTFLSNEEEDFELRKRGKIEVVIQRGKFSNARKRKRQSIDQSDDDDPESLPFPDETTKTVAMDNGKSNFIVPKALRPHVHCCNTKRPKQEWKAANLPAGERIRFTFVYTSRMYLEIANIVPIIMNPGTLQEAVVIDENAPLPSPPPNPPPRRRLSQDFGTAKSRNGRQHVDSDDLQTKQDTGGSSRPESSKKKGKKPIYLTNNVPSRSKVDLGRELELIKLRREELEVDVQLAELDGGLLGKTPAERKADLERKRELIKLRQRELEIEKQMAEVGANIREESNEGWNGDAGGGIIGHDDVISLSSREESSSSYSESEDEAGDTPPFDDGDSDDGTGNLFILAARNARANDTGGHDVYMSGALDGVPECNQQDEAEEPDSQNQEDRSEPAPTPNDDNQSEVYIKQEEVASDQSDANAHGQTTELKDGPVRVMKIDNSDDAYRRSLGTGDSYDSEEDLYGSG